MREVVRWRSGKGVHVNFSTSDVTQTTEASEKIIFFTPKMKHWSVLSPSIYFLYYAQKDWCIILLK